MDEEFDIVVTGFDVDDRQAQAGLTRVFGLSPSDAQAFLRTVPRVAKRGANRASAEHYLSALRSIGATVECHSAPPVDRAEWRGRVSDRGLATHSSLPLPPASMMPELQESSQVERAAEQAIARFRAAEGLETPPSLPPLDLLNPAIPRAPALPADLARLPNARLPVWSDPPAWVMNDPLSQAPTDGPSAGAWHEVPQAPSSLPSPGSESSWPVGADSGPSIQGRRHSRPGSSPAGDNRAREAWIARLRRRDLLLVLCAVAAIGYFTGAFSHLLRTDADLRRERWAEGGVSAGEHAPADAWLADEDTEVAGLSRESARTFIERIREAGARDVYAIGIQDKNEGKRASALLVELPADPEKRRAIFYHAARARGQEPSIKDDHGQAFQVLTFR